MARTQAADYGERRETIVEKAAELFARRGFLGASVADLASALGASKSLIYHYYPSKEDILFEVMESHLRELADAAEAVAASTDDPATKLRELSRSFMRLYVGAASRHKVLLNELDNLPAPRRAEIIARQKRMIDIVEGIITALQPKLTKKTRLRRPAAMLFFGMINWTHTWFRVDGGADAMQIADMATALALRGLEGVG